MSDDDGCCSPSRGGAGESPAVARGSGRGVTNGMVLVPAGSFWMGSDDAYAYPDDGEGPPRELELAAYWVDSCTVTNAAFGAFVGETGVRHRGRALRMVVRLRRPPARRLPADAGRRAGAVVAQDRGLGLAAPGRAALVGRVPRGSSGRARLVERRCRLRRLGRKATSHRGGVGAGCPGRPRAHRLSLGRRARPRRRAPHERLAGRVPPAELTRGRLPRNGTGAIVSVERTRAIRRRPATSGSGRPTASTSRPRRECRRAARTSATTPTAAGIALPLGSRRRRTARPGTSGSAARGTTSTRSGTSTSRRERCTSRCPPRGRGRRRASLRRSRH